MKNDRRAKIEAWLVQARRMFALQNKPLTTERQYCHFIRQYLWFTYSQPRDLASERKVENWLSELVLKRDIAASTQNVAFNAVVWFYKHVLRRELKEVKALRAQRPAQVRTALPVEDVLRLLEAVPDVSGYPTRLLVHLLYSRGLRLSEAISLRVKDVCFRRNEITIRAGKGQKDRVIALTPDLIVPLQRQLVCAHQKFEMDGRARVPIALERGLGRKYPEYRFSWPWAWVFPQHWPCRHPRTGELVRYHLPGGKVQQAVRECRRELGLHPQLTPHVLRHSFATHLLDQGTNIKALQEHLGHADIRTTAGYCHAEAKSVPSPLRRWTEPAVTIGSVQVNQVNQVNRLAERKLICPN